MRKWRYFSLSLQNKFYSPFAFPPSNLVTTLHFLHLAKPPGHLRAACSGLTTSWWPSSSFLSPSVSDMFSHPLSMNDLYLWFTLSALYRRVDPWWICIRPFGSNSCKDLASGASGFYADTQSPSASCPWTCSRSYIGIWPCACCRGGCILSSVRYSPWCSGCSWDLTPRNSPSSCHSRRNTRTGTLVCVLPPSESAS